MPSNRARTNLPERRGRVSTASALGAIGCQLLAPLELGHPGMLIPVAVITLIAVVPYAIAVVPYAIAEVRRSDRESRAPRR